MRKLQITRSQFIRAAVSASVLLALTAGVYSAWLWLSPVFYQTAVQQAAAAAAAADAAAASIGTGPCGVEPEARAIAAAGAGHVEAGGRMICDLGAGLPKSGPVIIGGVGDSGTRGVLAAFQAAGFYMGGEDRTGGDMPNRDLGVAGDKTMFALVGPASRRHVTSLLRLSRFQETGHLLPIAPHWDELLFGRNDSGGAKGVRSRDVGLCRKVAVVGREATRVLEERRARGEPAVGWGWKNPKSVLLLSAWQEALAQYNSGGGGGGMTFVHVMRDGRDVTYGDNRQQYDMFANEVYADRVRSHKTARDRMRWWAAVNMAIHRHAATTLPPDRYIVLRIEDLVTAPTDTLFRLFHDRLGLDVTISAPAASGGRQNAASSGAPQWALSEPLAALANRSTSYASSYLGARYSPEERVEALAGIGDAGGDALDFFGYRRDDWGLAGPCRATGCV